MLNIVAISGSLRQASSNTALLEALMALAPDGVGITRYRGLGELPLFNPDQDASPPPSVRQLRDMLVAADGVILATPEYAHGIAGAFKNGLDWLVGCPGLEGKPVALLNASGRAQHSYAATVEILAMMDWIVLPEASLTIAIASTDGDAAALRARPEVAERLRRVIAALTAGILARQVDAQALSAHGGS
jgi:chromate reductase